MKDNLRLILLVVGVIAIAALLIHGIWSSRKERSSLFGKSSKSKNRERQQRRDEIEDDIEPLAENFTAGNEEFEESVGPVTRKKNTSKKANQLQPEFSFDDPNVADNTVSITSSSQDTVEVTRQNSINIDESTLENQSDYLENPNDYSYDETGQNFESELGQMENQGEELTSTQPDVVDSEPIPQIPQLVIVFHIIGINDKPLRGDLLLNSFLNSGLHYGNMSIFHRHLSSADTPVLFSVANMVKPGIFEPNNMADFTTPGITCFMVLPTAGQPQQNFKLMLQTVQRIADDVGGNVYDEHRRLLTPQKIEEHRLSIRKWVEENC